VIVGHAWRSITDLDLIHDVEAILVSLVRERDSDQCIYQTVRVARCSCKRIAEVGTGVGNGCVASEDYQTGDADAVCNYSAEFSQCMIVILTRQACPI
jgi:hypothetical protein